MPLQSIVPSRHWSSAHYNILSDHPPLLHRQQFSPSSTNPNSYPVPANRTYQKDRIQYHKFIVAFAVRYLDDANVDLVRDLRIPLDACDSAIQDALMKLFNAQVRDESGSDAGEG